MVINTFINKKYNDMLYDTKPVKFSDFMSNKYNIVHKNIYNNALKKYINEWLKVKKLIKDNKILSKKLKDDNQHFESIFDVDYNKLQNKFNSNQNFINAHNSDKKYVDGDLIYEVNTYDEFIDNANILEKSNEEYWQPSKCVIITKFLSLNSPNLKWEVDLTPYWNKYQEKKDKEIENIILSQENILDSEIIDLNYVKGKAKLYSENLGREYEVDFDYLDGNNNKIADEYLLSKNSFLSNK